MTASCCQTTETLGESIAALFTLAGAKTEIQTGLQTEWISDHAGFHSYGI